jgi:serine/threonine-protein kinase
MGTATYFSPEQAQGLKVDGRSDVYSLGVVLYEMTTGKPPFSGETPVAIAYQHVREQPLAPIAVNPDIPAALDAIILQAIAKLPAERYATAEDFRADLDRFVRGQTVIAVAPQAHQIDGTQSIPQTTLIPKAGAGHTEEIVKGDGIRIPSTTGRWLAAGLVLLLAIALVVGIGGRALGYFGGEKYVKIPDVVGMNLKKAESMLSRRGLRSSPYTASKSSGKAQGTVLTEVPGYPSTTRGPTTIRLGVAGAAPKGVVPSVTGVPATSAIAALEQAGFKVKKDFVKQSTSSQTQGDVIKQSPKAGSSKRVNTTVTISIVSGTKDVVIPSFVVKGAPESAGSAIVAITKANLNLGTQTPQFSSKVPTGDVISSDPPTGKSVLQGTPVNLIVSEGPGETVPYLYGASLASAEEDLTSSGLTYFVGRIIGTTNPLYNGNVAYQQYTPGTMVATGTAVKIRIGVIPGSATTTSTTTTIPATSSSTTTTTTPPTSVPPLP